MSAKRDATGWDRDPGLSHPHRKLIQLKLGTDKMNTDKDHGGFLDIASCNKRHTTHDPEIEGYLAAFSSQCHQI